MQSQHDLEKSYSTDQSCWLLLSIHGLYFGSGGSNGNGSSCRHTGWTMAWCYRFWRGDGLQHTTHNFNFKRTAMKHKVHTGNSKLCIWHKRWKEAFISKHNASKPSKTAALLLALFKKPTFRKTKRQFQLSCNFLPALPFNLKPYAVFQVCAYHKSIFMKVLCFLGFCFVFCFPCQIISNSKCRN